MPEQLNDRQIVEYLTYLHHHVCFADEVSHQAETELANQMRQLEEAAGDLLARHRETFEPTAFAQFQGNVETELERKKEELSEHGYATSMNQVLGRDETEAARYRQPYKLPREGWHGIHATTSFDNTLGRISDTICYYVGLIPTADLTIETVSPSTELAELDQLSSKQIVGTFQPPNRVRVRRLSTVTPAQALSTLVHELCHYFLARRDIRFDDEPENEVLTDLCAAYLNLAEVMLEGMRDKWTSVLGYVSHETLNRANVLAGRLRQPVEEIDVLLKKYKRSTLTNDRVGRKILIKVRDRTVLAVVCDVGTHGRVSLIDMVDRREHEIVLRREKNNPMAIRS